MNPDPLRIEKAVYGGDGLARTASGEVLFVPFALPGELVHPATTGLDLRILEPSPDRVEPRCIHFGVCGGCQYQMAAYPAQLALKQAILAETLQRSGLPDLPGIRLWPSPEPWGYRNRIRLRVRETDGALRLGYSIRGTNDFLPVTMCPISAPLLWETAAALMDVAARNLDAADWVRSAAEIELFCNDTATQVQIHLLCPGAVPRRKGSFERFARAIQEAGHGVHSMGASRLHAASGRPLESLESWGADGLAYRVAEESFWLKRGSFFQVNRFLIPAMVELVTANRAGALAWDLFAGAGLFARTLARSFERVTAVEASPVASNELHRGLARFGPGHTAVRETTLFFLRQAVVQRDRPDLIVLDPPRAGAGEEACHLLARLAPPEIVYVSCDPTTLARDLAVLTAAEYTVAELHLIDLFPQTYHLETVIVLRRQP